MFFRYQHYIYIYTSSDAQPGGIISNGAVIIPPHNSSIRHVRITECSKFWSVDLE